MSTKLHLLICFLIFNSSYSIAQLYTNGSLVTGTVAADGFVAPTGYSWSEMQHNTGNSTQANAPRVCLPIFIRIIQPVMP